MARTMLVLLTLSAIGSTAPAQEVKEGVYTHKDLGLKFSVPKEWTLRVSDFKFGWGDGTLAEWVSVDQEIGGCLYHEELSVKVEKYADAVELNVKAIKGVSAFKRIKEEKLTEHKEGTWLLREYRLNYYDNEFRRVCLFVNNGKHDYNFSSWCSETRFDEFKEAIAKVIDSFELGGR